MKYVFLICSFLISQFFYSQEIVGNTDFNPVDRIAIKNVIDAYGVYWDTNQLDKWMSLFTEDAIDSRILNKKKNLYQKLKQILKCIKKEWNISSRIKCKEGI